MPIAISPPIFRDAIRNIGLILIDYLHTIRPNLHFVYEVEDTYATFHFQGLLHTGVPIEFHYTIHNNPEHILEQLVFFWPIINIFIHLCLPPPFVPRQYHT